MANYLNHDIRMKAHKLIRAHVEENYGKSKFGREAAEAKFCAEEIVRDLIRRKYDQSDMEVLKRYGQTNEARAVSYHLGTTNSGLKVLSTWGGASHLTLDLGCNANAFLLVPDGHNVVQKIIDNLKGDTNPHEFEALELAWVLNDAAKCEINKLISGYNVALMCGRTREIVVREHPHMEKFLPYNLFDDGGKPQPATDKQVLEFEKEINEKAAGE